MCIICNLTNNDDWSIASDFLQSFAAANLKMREAERDLLRVAAKVGPEDRARYLKLHKAMVKQRRQWNRLEQFREKSS